MTMPQNPIAMGANVLRQIGETANQTVMTLGNQFAQTNSQILRGIATGAPPGLPLPGAAGNPGNPNGQLGLFPLGNGAAAGPLGLPLPTEALRSINQLENSILPAGLPRPSAVLLAAANGRPPAEAVEEAVAPMTGHNGPRPGAALGAEGLNGLDRRGARAGIQLV
jgi:hypothetical protein